MLKWRAQYLMFQHQVPGLLLEFDLHPRGSKIPCQWENTIEIHVTLPSPSTPPADLPSSPGPHSRYLLPPCGAYWELPFHVPLRSSVWPWKAHDPRTLFPGRKVGNIKTDSWGICLLYFCISVKTNLFLAKSRKSNCTASFYH